MKEGVVQVGNVERAYRGSGSTAPHIVNLGIAWRSVVSFTLRPLFGREGTTAAIQIRGRMGTIAGPDALEKRKSLVPTGIRALGCSSRSLVTVPTGSGWI